MSDLAAAVRTMHRRQQSDVIELRAEIERLRDANLILKGERSRLLAALSAIRQHVNGAVYDALVG